MSHQSPDNDGISSGDNDLFTVEGVAEEVPDSPAGFQWWGSSGEIVDAELVDERPARSRMTSSPEDAQPPDDDKPPKAGPPSLGEWQDFWSRIVIRMATDFYIDAAFSGIDENLISDREIDRIKLTKAERDRMSKPFAELSNKLKFTRKHGRTIIASAGTMDAVLQMGMWVARVNRVRASVERRMNGNAPRPVRTMTARQRPSQPAREGTENVSAEQGTPSGAGNGTGRWRPTIAGQVFNPDAG